MKKILLLIIAALSLATTFSQSLDRSKKPPAGPAPKINLKDPVIYKLANGMTVLVVENHTLPQINASLSIDAGPIAEGARAGTLDMLSGMLNEGTKSKSKLQFNEAVAQIGANVSLGWNGGGLTALTRYFDQAFALFAEGLRQPAFPEASFEKLKSQTITAIKANEKNVKAITVEVGSALIYGKNHPSGEITSLATVDKITLDDVKAAYKKYSTPSRSYFTFVGDITPAAAKALVEKYFGNWTGPTLKLAVLKPVLNPAKTEIDVIDFPNAVQSEIRVANLVNIPMTSADYFPAILANEILGGGSDARLFMNLREKHGFTYGSYSSVGTGRYQRDFSATASVRNEKTDSAITEILSEIKRMGTEKVSAEELLNAKALYNGSFAMRLEDPSRAATLASNILIDGLPKDFYKTYLQKINAVTAEDVQRVAKKYFEAGNARLIVGGKEEQILPSLKKLGFPVKIYDKNADSVSETATASGTAAASADISGAQVIKNYLAAIGGEAELNKVKSIILNGEMEVQGQSLTATLKKMAPNMESMEISMSGQAVMKQSFNGASGYAMQMGNKKDMDQKTINEKKDINSLFEQLGYASKNVKLEVAGTAKVNGSDTYKLKVTYPSGKTKVEYYDVKTGLLLKEEETVEAEGQSVTTMVEFRDYKKTGNIMFPSTLIQSAQTAAGNQEFTIVIASVKVNEGVTAEDFK
ncbi:MAG: insulinase family protein [Chitinophagaceae bacterium]